MFAKQRIRPFAYFLSLLAISFLLTSALARTGIAYSEEEADFVYIPVTMKLLRILIADDFSYPDSGWAIDKGSHVERSYQNGEYEIWIDKKGRSAGALAPAGGFMDYSVQADMYLTSETDSRYGLIFDFENWDNYYIYVVHPGEGWYGVSKIENGQSEFPIPATGSFLINAEEVVNRLRVKRVGNRIDVFVNDKLVDSVFESEVLNRGPSIDDIMEASATFLTIAAAAPHKSQQCR